MHRVNLRNILNFHILPSNLLKALPLLSQSLSILTQTEKIITNNGWLFTNLKEECINYRFCWDLFSVNILQESCKIQVHMVHWNSTTANTLTWIFLKIISCFKYFCSCFKFFNSCFVSVSLLLVYWSTISSLSFLSIEPKLTGICNRFAPIIHFKGTKVLPYK